MKSNKSIGNIILEVVSVLALVGTWVPMFYYGALKGVQVPRHYNLAGVIDGWGGREFILVLAIITTVLYAIFTLCEKRPQCINSWKLKKEHYIPLVYNFCKQIKCWLMLMLFYINFTSLGIAMGFVKGMMSWIIYVLLGLMFLSLTCFMLKAKRKQQA